METYQGQINEFVDWVTGIDSRTESNVTSSLPVSGYSIRQLLQEHLKKPFVKYDDKTGGQYLFFSSEEAKDEWLRLTDVNSPLEDQEKATTLVITSMARPSDTAVDVKAIVDGQETDIGNSRYITSGDSTSDAANIRFVVRMYKEQAGQQQPTSDSFTVTYDIKNSLGNTTQIVEDYNSDRVTTGEEVQTLSFNCYSYLTEGTNSIHFTVSSKNTGAMFTRDITVYLIRFTISSTYQFYNSPAYDSEISIPISVNTSIQSMTLNTYAEVVNGAADNKLFTVVANNTYNGNLDGYSTNLTFKNTFPSNSEQEDHIQHTIKVYATLGSGGSATQFTSNVIYFTFETASSTEGLLNKFINVKYDTPSNRDYTENGNVILYAQQYEPFVLDWSYYTDHLNQNSSINVTWYLRYKSNEEYSEIAVGTGIGAKGTISSPFNFIPEIWQSLEDGAYLVVKEGNTELQKFKIIIAKSSYDISETADAVLKLSAYGKSNNASDRDQWIDSVGGVTTTFNNIMYDDRSGWTDNSLFVQGSNTTAVINYNPISTEPNFADFGKTIEIEFTPVKSNNDSDVLIRIGNAEAGHIDIKPTGAYLYIGNSTTDTIHTNYKVGERQKLAFVFNKQNGSDRYTNALAYIINNGILERAAAMQDAASYSANSGNITIGGTDSSVKVYSIRIYNKPLTYQQELNNYIFDSLDKASIISRNQIFKNGQLDFDLVKNKIDTILIEGLAGDTYKGLNLILDAGTSKEDSESTVNIRRTCISDNTKSFYIQKAMIRKHGQSTINYPITALKFWLNKSATVGDTPSFVEQSESQRVQGLNKNRYIMKNGAVPSNKFVLQANYADSSGVHNGGILRLIQNTWYNATFGSNNEFKLRTAPQLFASGYIVTHNNANLGEDGSWVEGYGTGRAEGKTWPEFTGREFPYTIRNSADSFPCAVFYNNPLGDGNTHFLGQYVFMDDKKSDYIYGERSIYSFGDNSDPFVLRTENTKNGVNGKQDTAANRVWNNKNVLQVEIVLPNTLVTSYMGMNVPTALELDSDGNITSTGGSMVPCTGIKYDLEGNPQKYYWEDYFEMIYPDPDDLAEDDAKLGIDKFNPNSNFVATAKPFIDFLTWITSISALNVDGNGRQYTDGTVAPAALNKFIAESHDHLDLYKLAAYYIFFLRFGLVDSVERNAQLKTYDGIHFHYEPWDMDIAMGNTNQGRLVLNPPLTRSSVIPGTSTKAFSGRGDSTSNFLWDCLEAWDYWSKTLVPEVAEALYNAGLTYENASKMFDEEYSDKWSESMYNEAGYFKYIQNGGEDYLPWLQGSRASHRHWWLSTSMNYYDAMWSCGTFKSRRVVLFVDKGLSQPGTDILSIKATSNTYFELTSSGGTASIERKPANLVANFDISANSFSAKDPTWIYGGSFIEELDLSCFAKTMATVDVSRCYDDVLGANIKKLVLGVPLSGDGDTRTGQISGTQLRISAANVTNNTDALEILETLDVTGQSSIQNTSGIFVTQDRTSIKNFYAAGTSIVGFQNAPSGNTFTNLVLPATTIVNNADNSVSESNINSFVMHNASWQNLEFWNTTATSVPTQALDENNEPIFVEGENGEQVPVYNPASATYNKITGIPSSIRTVTFDGSTARNECSIRFILDWIDAIKKTLASYNSSTGEYDKDELHTVLESKQFIASNINWTTNFSTQLTYDDLENIAHLNGTTTIAGGTVFNNTRNRLIKGYVVLNGELDAEKMVNIKQWFGSSAFDKAAITSQLVVDSASDNVVIGIDGASVSDGQLYLNEGSTASMQATKFLLGDNAAQNFVVGPEHPNLVGDEILWSVGSPEKTQWGSTYQESVRLEVRQSDGMVQLIADRNYIGDFAVCVRASYLDSNLNTQFAYLDVNIIGTTYPSSYTLTVSGSGVRQFLCTNAIGAEILSSGYSTDDPIYVMHTQNQTMDIGVTLDGTYNADAPRITADVEDLFGNSIVGGTLDVNTINQTTYSDPQGTSSVIKYINSTEEGKLRLVAYSVPANRSAYRVKMNIKFPGLKPAEVKSMYIIAWDDNTPIVTIDTTNPLYLAIRNKYNTDYSLANETNFAVFKTHILSLYGTFDLSTYNSVQSLVTNNQQSIFNYMPYITSIILDGCTNLTHRFNSTGDGFIDVFNFTNMPNLTSISLNGCTGLNATNLVPNTLSLATCPNVTSLDVRNTTIGVNIPANHGISTLQLGSPLELIIGNSTTGVAGLSLDNVSIQSTSSLDSLELNHISYGGNLITFKLFDKLFNAA